MGHAMRATALLLVLAVGLPTVAAADEVWFDPERGGEIRLEAVKPAFDAFDLTTFSMVWYLSGRFPVGERLTFRAEVPYAHFEDDEYSESSTSTIGNPYLGVVFAPNPGGFGGDVGVRLPAASDSEAASLLGAFTDFVDRYEAFTPDVASLNLGLDYQRFGQSGMGVRMRVGPVVWFDTGDALEDGLEAWLRYNLQFVQRLEMVSFGGGISGRYWVTNDDRDGFGERSWNEFDLFCNVEGRVLRPSLRLRLPMDEDLKSVLDTSFVLSLGVALD